MSDETVYQQTDAQEWRDSVQTILEQIGDCLDVWSGPPEGLSAVRAKIRDQVAARLFAQALDCAGPSRPQRLVDDDEIVRLSEWCWHVAAIHADLMPEVREAARRDGLLEILGDPPQPHRAAAAEPTLRAEAGLDGIELADLE